MSDNTIQNLFNHMYNNHGLTLLVGEMDEIARIFDNYKIELADRAFVAGRSQTSWEQFKKDNELITHEPFLQQVATDGGLSSIIWQRKEDGKYHPI